MQQGMSNQPTPLNQPMGQGLPGQSQGSAMGMPGPAQDGERGWKGAAAGGIGGGRKPQSITPFALDSYPASTVGGNQLGDTGTTLISTCKCGLRALRSVSWLKHFLVAGAVLSVRSCAIEKFAKSQYKWLESRRQILFWRQAGRRRIQVASIVRHG